MGAIFNFANLERKEGKSCSESPRSRHGRYIVWRAISVATALTETVAFELVQKQYSDDGDSHPCVQMISYYGIYCKYFLHAVLPAERKLYEQIIEQNELRPKKEE